MKMKFVLAGILMLLPFSALIALPLTGFYQTIDDETNKPKSIVALYEYGDEALLGARIVALYDAETGKVSETLSKPVRIAEKVDGKPHLVGLDIVWDMKWDEKNSEYKNGKIMDPKKGSVYSSVVWQDEKDTSKLRVRGKIGPFGRTQVWNVMKVSELPIDLQKLNMSAWTPEIMK